MQTVYGILIFILLVVSEEILNPKEDLSNKVNNNDNSTPTSFMSTMNISAEIEDSQCYNNPIPQMTICPEGFIKYSFNRCIWIKENQPFPPSCPYPHFYNYDHTEALISELFSSLTVWINAFRNSTSGFPEFEWMENGLYGQNVTRDINNIHDGFGKDCLVVKKGLFYRVSCTEKHFAVCVYSRNLFLSSRASKRCNVEGYHTCMLANYDLGNQKCFCKKLNNLRPKKNAFCKQLIEPLPFQSVLLAYGYRAELYKHDKCWMGLYKEKQSKNIYKWLSTNEIINYTHWVSEDSCKYFEGAYKFSYKYEENGWVLLEDESLTCALCELPVVYKTSYLQLQHAKSTDNIQLLISNPNTISDLGRGFVGYLDVYCYSDRSTKVFKELLPMKILTTDFSNDDIYVLHDIPLVENQPSHYWCVAYQYPSFNPIVSNTIVAVKKTNCYGHEFSIQVNFKVDSKHDPVSNRTYVNVCNYFKEIIINAWDHILTVRPMRGYIRSKYHMDMIIHITTENTHQSATEQQLKLMEIIKDMHTPEIKLSDVFSSEVCLFSTSLTIDGEILEWPETQIGATAIPSNMLCLDTNNYMLPITRNCTGSFLFGAKWSKPIGNCYSEEDYGETTMMLFNLTKNNVSAENIIDTLGRVTKNSTNMKIIDIHLIATLLEKLETFKAHNLIGKSYIRIVSNIMDFNKNILRDAQLLVNSTDKILSSLDNILKKQNVTSIVSSRLLTEIVHINDENIIGLALLKQTVEGGVLEYYRIFLLFQNTSLDNLTKDLVIAIILPDFKKENINISKTPLKLIVTIFFNDILFNSIRDNQTNNKVVSVIIPNITGFLKTTLKILFKTATSSKTPKHCCYWNYGLDDLMVSKHGHWEKNSLSKTNSSFIEMCEYNHMTHFGLFLKDKVDEHPNDGVLRILTALGSGLSLIGIIPIFITAILFKQWRHHLGNIILLNFCMAIALQVILTFSLYAINKDGGACKAIGALFHYSILSEFCWMLVVAILEYKRFVIVFNKPQSDSILKYVIIGWGIPLTPVTITLLISPENYKMNHFKFCYVTENYFIFGLLLPIILILLNNLIVFVGIFYSIWQTKLSNIEKNRNYKLEIFLAILLFFMLGLSWLFGVVGALGGGIWFTYLFCITASIRGIILFSFFIVGNKETRRLWKRCVKRYIIANVIKTT